MKLNAFFFYRLCRLSGVFFSELLIATTYRVTKKSLETPLFNMLLPVLRDFCAKAVFYAFDTTHLTDDPSIGKQNWCQNVLSSNIEVKVL